GVWPRHSVRPRGVIRRSVLRRPSRHGRQRSRPPRPTRDARPKPASLPGRRGTRIRARSIARFPTSKPWPGAEPTPRKPCSERRGELAAAFLRVAQLDPDLDGAGAERELGALYAALPAYAGGDLEEARRYLLAAVQRAPEDARNHVVLARAVAVKAQDRALFR